MRIASILSTEKTVFYLQTCKQCYDAICKLPDAFSNTYLFEKEQNHSFSSP